MTNKKFLPITFFFLIMWCVALAYLPLTEASSAVQNSTMMSSSPQNKDNGSYKALNANASHGRYWNRSLRRFEVPSTFSPDGIDSFKVAAIPKPDELLGPKLKTYPEEYVDDGRLFVDFTCEAFLEKGDVLYWMASDGDPNNVGIHDIYKENEDRAENKTLKLYRITYTVPSNAIIYCFKDPAGGKNKTYSKMIPIVWHRKRDPPLRSNFELFLWPEPTNDGIIYYNDTSPLELACWSRTGRDKLLFTNTTEFVTMYQIQGSRNKRLAMMAHDLSNFRRAEYSKIWMVSDSGTKLFCAKEFKWADGSMHTKELTPQYTLVYRSETEDCSAWDSWAWAAVAMVTAFVAEATAVAIAAIYSFCNEHQCSN